MISSSSDSRWVFQSIYRFQDPYPSLHLWRCMSGHWIPTLVWEHRLSCRGERQWKLVGLGLLWCVLGPSAYMLWILSNCVNRFEISAWIKTHDSWCHVQHIHHRSAKCGTLFLIVWSDGWLKNAWFFDRLAFKTSRCTAEANTEPCWSKQLFVLGMAWWGLRGWRDSSGGMYIYICIYFINCLTRFCPSTSIVPTSYLSY